MKLHDKQFILFDHFLGTDSKPLCWQVHREQQKAKRMLEERLKITTLEERLKTEMSAAGGQLSLEMGAGMGTAEALRQAMQHEDLSLIHI